MNHPFVVVVSQRQDAIAAAAAARLQGLGASVRLCAPSKVALLNVELTDCVFRLAGVSVAAVLWRVPPGTHLSDDVASADQGFSDAEAAATWIAAMQLPTIFAVNQLDAETWYGSVGWPHWRARLGSAAVPLTPMAFGDGAVPDDWTWSPYTAQYDCELPQAVVRASMATASHRKTMLESTIAVCGKVVSGAVTADIRRAAALLDTWGVRLAAIGSDASGRIHHVDPFPIVTDASLVEEVSRRLADCVYDNCRNR